MRALSISLLLFASSASAQSLPSVDCGAVKNSTVPFELAYHSQNGTRTVVQAYRDKSGVYSAWSRQTPPSNHPNPPVFVVKATYVDGAIASAELWTPYVGKYSHRTAKYTTDRFPKHFDHRSDVNYKIQTASTAADGATEEKTTTISYKFKSAGTIGVGDCEIQIIHGEIDATNDADRTHHIFQLYFPELQVSATAADAEPIVDSLYTVFAEIKPPN